MKWWKAEEGTLVEGTKLEYCGYKLSMLREYMDKGKINTEYYQNQWMHYVEQIVKEMMRDEQR